MIDNAEFFTTNWGGGRALFVNGTFHPRVTRGAKTKRIVSRGVNASGIAMTRL